MQIEGNQSVCPACGAEELEIVPVLHHMMCAYVGPQYDFAATEIDIPVRNAGARLCRATPFARSWGQARAVCDVARR